MLRRGTFLKKKFFSNFFLNQYDLKYIKLTGLVKKIVNASTGQVVSVSGATIEMLDWITHHLNIK